MKKIKTLGYNIFKKLIEPFSFMVLISCSIDSERKSRMNTANKSHFLVLTCENIAAVGIQVS